MPAAEMKHGPIALINEGMPVVFIATQGMQYDKVISNIEEVRARGGEIIAVATEGDTNIRRYSDHVIYVPDAPEPLQPLLTVVPLQLLAYHAAVAARLQRGQAAKPGQERDGGVDASERSRILAGLHASIAEGRFRSWTTLVRCFLPDQSSATTFTTFPPRFSGIVLPWIGLPSTVSFTPLLLPLGFLTSIW